MPHLVDTNLLLRSAQAGHPQQEEALQAIAALLRRGEQVLITPQNLVEFWAVSTRPVDRNGLGLTIEAAAAELARLQAYFPVLPETPALIAEWQQLVVTHRVIGLKVYDARLVASMLVHGVTHILTFNVEDFRRYAEITVVHPRDVEPPAG
jgi:predicted nucleic acid-binding protein